MKRDFEPPAIWIGRKRLIVCENVGTLTFEPFSPPNCSLSFKPHTITVQGGSLRAEYFGSMYIARIQCFPCVLEELCQQLGLRSSKCLAVLSLEDTVRERIHLDQSSMRSVDAGVDKLLRPNKVLPCTEVPTASISLIEPFQPGCCGKSTLTCLPQTAVTVPTLPRKILPHL
ncbi:hypothetical protein GQX74_007087 [Glossina fuscipes]|nr:hypothetical protein GQX74_007087 [Glossina fuscipes]